MDRSLKKERSWLTPYKPLHRHAVAPPLTPKEKAQIAYFREFRAHCREGPYFTELRSNAKVSKSSDGQKAGAYGFDGFEGLKTYTNKYRRKARAAPRVDTRPHYKYLITVEGGRQCALAEVNQDLHTKDLCNLLTKVEGAGEWELEVRRTADSRTQWQWTDEWRDTAQV